MRLRMSFLLLSVLSLCVVPLAAHADIITYTVSGTASGSLDGTAFSNALVTITGSADNSDIFSPLSMIYDNIALTAPTLTVAGVGTDTFTDTLVYVSNQNRGIVGVSDMTRNLALFLVNSSALTSYDLSTAVGPVSGTPVTNLGKSFATSLGTFEIDSANNPTFTATDNTTPAVPEPSSLLLLTTGMMGFAGAVKRKLS
jgi:hypothetical protein